MQQIMGAVQNASTAGLNLLILPQKGLTLTREGTSVFVWVCRDERMKSFC